MSELLGRIYRVVEKDVAHEIIDGEAIIIHFSTGNYYSLNGLAAEIWKWVEAGATDGEMKAAFSSLNSVQEQEIENFLEGLVKEEILLCVEARTVETRRSEGIPKAGSSSFSTPRFDKYNDMQSLLLADPIHEVDDQRGWPHTPTKPSA
jgi:hypothetical protein